MGGSMIPPLDDLREVFSYDPATGILLRRSTGKPAGVHKHSNGLVVEYVYWASLGTGGRVRKLKRLAVVPLVVALHTGRWPERREYALISTDKLDLQWANIQQRFTKTEQRCTACMEMLPHDAFHVDNTRKRSARYPKCRNCARADNAKWNRKSNRRRLLKKYDLSELDYHRLLVDQGGTCKICGGLCTSGKRLAVDHCHKSGEVRGLLCRNCNLGLGHYRDNPKLLLLAAKYLLKT